MKREVLFCVIKKERLMIQKACPVEGKNVTSMLNTHRRHMVLVGNQNIKLVFRALNDLSLLLVEFELY